MKKIKRLLVNMDTPLLIVTIILFVFGLLNIVNASSQAVVIRYGTNLYYYFYRQLAILLVSLVAFFIIIKVPTKKYYKVGTFLYIVILLCLIYLPIFGKAYLGSINWIDLKFFKFQPSEFAKIAMIIMTALVFEKFYKRLKDNVQYTRKDHFTMIGIILLVGILVIGFVLLEHDLGTAIIMFGIYAVLFLASPIQKSEKLSTIVVVLITMFVGMFAIFATKGSLLSEEQKSRITDFNNPCKNYEDGGYQVCNGIIAINSGGLFGVGVGNSKQVSYLPESHTDSIFAIISEEYGLIICTLIFIMYIFVLYRIFKLASTTTIIRNRYMCLGIGTYIALHIIVNLGGIFASMPLTGVPLPFLSYGGSYTLCLACSLAMVQRMNIEKNNEKIKIKR